MRSKTNLLKETIEAMTKNGKLPVQVVRVDCAVGYREKKSFSGSWDDFAELSGAIEYDSGFGGQEINETLMVIGSDWWLERHEYDGSEWWEFKSLPKPLDAAQTLTADSLLNRSI
jgi:hypothetical protein